MTHENICVDYSKSQEQISQPSESDIANMHKDEDEIVAAFSDEGLAKILPAAAKSVPDIEAMVSKRNPRTSRLAKGVIAGFINTGGVW